MQSAIVEWIKFARRWNKKVFNANEKKNLFDFLCSSHENNIVLGFFVSYFFFRLVKKYVEFYGFCKKKNKFEKPFLFKIFFKNSIQ